MKYVNFCPICGSIRSRKIFGRSYCHNDECENSKKKIKQKNVTGLKNIPKSMFWNDSPKNYIK